MTIEMDALQPGDLMFGPNIHAVEYGQYLLLARKLRNIPLPASAWRDVAHVGVIVGQSATGRPQLVQAMPKGAECVQLDTAKHWNADHVFIRPDYQRWTDPLNLLDLWYKHAEHGNDVAQAAINYVGTPYNFLTYAKLAAGFLRFRLTENLLKRWISTRHDMMCSQLADQALADAGYHVFDDGRLPQDVVPAELFCALLDKPGQWYRPNSDWVDTWRSNSAYTVREVANLE